MELNFRLHIHATAVALVAAATAAGLGGGNVATAAPGLLASAVGVASGTTGTAGDDSAESPHLTVEPRAASVAVAAEGGVYLRRDAPVAAAVSSRSSSRGSHVVEERGQHVVGGSLFRGLLASDVAEGGGGGGSDGGPGGGGRGGGGQSGARRRSSAVLAAEPPSSLLQASSATAREGVSPIVIDDEDRPHWNGAIRVARDVTTLSERIKLDAIIEECMLDSSLPECWEKFGSYDIKRLAAEEWPEIFYFSAHRPDWMKDPQVQKRKIFELTLPGTHHSGAFMVQNEKSDRAKFPYGVVTQNLNIDEQLMLGIRAFHFRVAWHPLASRLYASHLYPTLPLKPLLTSISKFLQEHTAEVVILSLERDAEVTQYTGVEDHLRMFTEEDKDRMRIPGQSVHLEVLSTFGRTLGLYDRLKDLPKGSALENPTISALVELNIRVIYFWEGQQVLCYDITSCKRTPGWAPNPSGWNLPFGPPLKYGERTEALASARALEKDGRAIEPTCLFNSEAVLKHERPETAVRLTKSFVTKMQELLIQKRPACFPADAPVPEPKTPTVMYVAGAHVTPTTAQIEAQTEIIGDSWFVYSRGEGFSVRSEAERHNYLLLNWFMRPSLQELYTAPNVISMDFPAPILVHRIIDAMQENQECGWAIFCESTGSCAASNLLDLSGKKPKCIDEATMEELLQHSLEQPRALLMFRMTVGLWVTDALLLLWMLAILIHWRGFLWLIRPDLVLKPKRTQTLLGALVFGFLGRARFRNEDVPNSLEVHGTDGFDGMYMLVYGQEPNEMPLWKWAEGESYIYSGTSGQWFFGDEQEKALQFKCLLGNYCTKNPHHFTMPHEAEEGSWQEFDPVTKQWTACPGLVVKGEARGFVVFADSDEDEPPNASAPSTTPAPAAQAAPAAQGAPASSTSLADPSAAAFPPAEDGDSDD